jgi:outer membrane protein assembly factor BamB
MNNKIIHDKCSSTPRLDLDDATASERFQRASNFPGRFLFSLSSTHLWRRGLGRGGSALSNPSPCPSPRCAGRGDVIQRLQRNLSNSEMRPLILRSATNVLTSSLAALFLLASGRVQAADWPQFRGPSSTGISEGPGVPTTLDTNKDLAWKADLPGRGLSSPIIIGDRVFVTCCSGLKQQRLHVICFKASDGSKLWERQFWATGRTMCEEKTSVAAPTPASDGKRIVAIFSSNDAVCLDLDGNLIWLRGLGRDYPNANNSLGLSSSLLIVGDVVVAQVETESEGFTVALDLNTGVNRWKIERPRKANWTSPILLNSGGQELVVLLSTLGVAAVESATGKVVWEYTDGGSSIPSCAVSGGILFVPTKRGLTALQPSAGGEKPKQLWQSSRLRAGTPSPIVLGQKVFILNDSGILICGDTATGERLWQLRMKGPFSATPVAVGHFLYCVSESGVAQVVDTDKPEGEVISELELRETILSTPAISSGAIYFRSDARIWKIGKASA